MGQEHIEFVFDDAKATIIQRGIERDQPDGERTIPRCVTAFNAITGHTLSKTDGWLFMEILKKCRSVQGAYKYDDYRDGVGYAALRAEEARMEHENEVLCDQTTEEARAGEFNNLSHLDIQELEHLEMGEAPTERQKRYFAWKVTLPSASNGPCGGVG
jgi:hypothetical protein